MNKVAFTLSAIALLLLISCADKKLNSSRDGQAELTKVAELMSGTFSSREQAKTDSSYYNINLVMHPIWETNTDAKWLYVEQAVTEYIKRPYRQRVYKITQTTDGQIKSAVYELPDPTQFIHSWEKPELFQQLSPDSLIVREGCAVYLRKDPTGCYSGSTRDKECKSTLRGATYATSTVKICPGEVLSWDQGWDGSDKQVWGATKAGYVFKKIN